MLVSRKQDWIVHEEQAPVVSVKSKPAVNKRLRQKGLLLVAFMVLIAMAVTVQRELIVRTGYSVVTLKSQAATMEKENEQLRLEIAKLKSQQRIKAIATNQLGMVAPQTLLYASAADGKTASVHAKPEERAVSFKAISVAKVGGAETDKGR